MFVANRKLSRLFISYAHSDGADAASRLADDLQSRGFEVWWDKERLRPGASWTTSIELGIDESEVVLALLSKGSYESDICRAEQLRALRKGKRVLPLVLQQHADLPIHLESEQYLTFFDGEYASALDRLVVAIRDQAVSASLLPKYRKRYRTYPPLPPHFIPRPELLSQLRQQIIRESDGRSVVVTAIRGMGGVGKTVLAQAICHDEAVQDAFPDGVLWLTIGEKPSSDDLRDQIRELAKGMGESLEGYDTLYGCENQLRLALSNKSVLIVLNDVWDPRDVHHFWADAPRCRLLITTRTQEVVRGADAEEFVVQVMEVEESLELLATKSGLQVTDLPPEAVDIIRECGALPLGLAMLGARVGKVKGEWSRVLRSLKEGRAHSLSLKLADYRYSDLFEAIHVSVQSLRPEHRSRYLDLAVFRADTPVPRSVLSTFWETDELDTDDTIASWTTASLATCDADGAVTLHDLQMDYVRKEGGDQRHRHVRLLQAYKASLSNGWESGPRDSYYFRWLAFHMREAGELQELRLLLLNPEWIRARLKHQNLGGLVDDFDFISSDPDCRTIRQALQLSFNVLARDPRQLASQLFGRLRSVLRPEIQNFLARIRNTQSHAWLEPMWVSLWQPGTLLLFTLAGHSRAINAVAIAPGGKRVISASDDGTLKVWDIDYGDEIRTLAGHLDSVTSVAMTPNGLQAVSGSADATVRVWQIDSGVLIHTLRGHSGPVRFVAVTADGRHVVSASTDHTIRIWTMDGETVHTLSGHTGPINALILTADSARVISASDDHTLRIWNLATGRQMHILAGHKSAVKAAALTPDGNTIVSGSNDSTLMTWDVVSGSQLHTLAGHTGAVAEIVITPNGRQVVSGSDDTTIKIWDIVRGQALQSLSGHSLPVSVIAITRDGSRLISASPDNTVKIWDLATGTELRSLTAHSGSVKAVLLTPEGSRAISFSDDATIRVWKTGTELHFQQSHAHTANALALTADGHFALTGSYDKTLMLWDLETGAHRSTLSGHGGPVAAVAISPVGDQAVSASYDKTLRVWDLRTASELRTLSGHTAPVRSVEYTPDGERAVSASYDKTIRIWDLASGQQMRALSGHEGPTVLVVTPSGVHVRDFQTDTESPVMSRSILFTHVVVSSDGALTVSACCDKTMRVWDNATGSIVRSLAGHTNWVSALVLTRDGTEAVSGSFDQTIKVWNLHNGEEQITMIGHSKPVNRLAISSDGGYILSASLDCTVKIWDRESARLVSSMEGHSAPVNAIAMTSDGARAFSVSDDHTLRVWNRNGSEIAVFTADGSILCLALCQDESMCVVSDFHGRIHLLKLHEETSPDVHP